MIPYGHQTIDARDIGAVTGVLKSDFLTQGPKIGEFEKALAKHCGVGYAVAFSNGTSALHGAYFVAGLKNRDEFITSPLTFAATANAGLYLGAKPVFADIDEDGNLDPIDVERKITKKTKLISVVDYTGRPAKLKEFKKLALKHGLVLIEDACQALGAEYGGKRAGSISDMTVFSFHPVKSITTGEGGAVLTNNKDYHEKLILFRSHGITKDVNKMKEKDEGPWYMEMQVLGYNYRLTDIQAVLGISQLKKVNKFISARREIAERYGKELKPLSRYIILPRDDSKNILSAWHLYVIRLTGSVRDKRRKVFESLRNAGIGVQVHHIPVYFHPYYEKMGYKRGLCPKAEDFYNTCISLPIFPSLSLKNQKTVIKKLKETIASIT